MFHSKSREPLVPAPERQVAGNLRKAVLHPGTCGEGGIPELRCRVMEVDDDDDDVDCYCFGDELHAWMESIRGHSMNVVDTSVLRQMTGQ